MRRIPPLHPSRRAVLGSALMYVHLFIYVPVIKETIEDHDGCLDADIILKIAFMERHVSFSHFLTHPCTFLGAIAVSRDHKLYQTETENCGSCRLCEGRGVLVVFLLFLEHLVINLQSSMLLVIERSRLDFCFLP